MKDSEGGRIDVLAVMEAAARREGERGCELSDLLALDEARAAVGELIEAARDAEHIYIYGGGFRVAMERLRAALSRVQS